MRTPVFLLFFFLLFILFPGTDNTANNKNFVIDGKEICLSPEEAKLINMINDYRKSNRLKPVPVSTSLTYVAQLHARDLSENYKFGDNKCNMHSWSENGNWTACCYSDHKDSECMWNKPAELTDYKGDGYEIAFGGYGTDFKITANNSLDAWKSSRSHNEVILNRGKWKEANWNAMGIGIYDNFAVVWFGMETDPAGSVIQCR